MKSPLLIKQQIKTNQSLEIKNSSHMMAYPQQRTTYPPFTNPEFTHLQNQIQQQTLALLRQRQAISQQLSQNTFINQPYLKPVESQKYIKLNSQRSQNNNNVVNQKNILTDKVMELLNLCKMENSSFSNQLIKVISDEKNIYNQLVSSNNHSSEKTQHFGVTNPIVEAQKQSSVFHDASRQQQQFSNPTSGNHSPSNLNLLTAKPTYYKDTTQQQQNNNQNNNPSNNNKLTSDELVQMIEEIQRKALNEIQKLREEKIDLMKQLKHQIQSNNQLQKQLNNYSQQQIRAQNQPHKQQNSLTPYKQFHLQQQLPSQKSSFQQQILRQIRTQMNNLKQQNQNLRFMNANQQQNHYQNGFNYSNTDETNGLRQRIFLLQGELRNRDNMIRGLTMELNRASQQAGGPSTSHLSNLLEQGETIRQNTLHLIRMKQGHSGHHQQAYQRSSFNESQRIRELEDLLEKQQEEKQNFLNDLLLFKQKYQQLEEQNRSLKRQSKLGSSDLAKFSPIYDKSTGPGIGASIDDYEKLLSQMKNANKY